MADKPNDGNWNAGAKDANYMGAMTRDMSQDSAVSSASGASLSSLLQHPKNAFVAKCFRLKTCRETPRHGEKRRQDGRVCGQNLLSWP